MNKKLVPLTATLITRAVEYNKEDLRTSFIKMVECHPIGEIKAVEVGVYEGINAKYMLLWCDRLKLYLVDAWDNIVIYTGGPVQNRDYCQMIKSASEINTFGFENRIVKTGKNSLEAVKDFSDESMDYVYIDGDHTYRAALNDMKAWYPKVKKGGILGGHDVAMEQVSAALDDFIKLNGIAKEMFGKEDGSEGRSDFWIYK